jgi:succinyl-diaminopimelate desuccinylase
VSLSLEFNFRFSTESTEQTLRARLEAVLKKHGLDYSVDWILGGRPFLTQRGRLVEVVSEAIRTHTGRSPELSTTGGTSDGRFIAEVCPQVVEFGPVNSSIHKLNEHIELGALEKLPGIYLDTLRLLLP